MSQFFEKAVRRDIKEIKSSKTKTALGKLLINTSQLYRSLYGEVDLQGNSAEPQRKQGRKEAPRPVDLKEIVAKCADRYIGLGFHTFIYPALPEEEAEEKYIKDFMVPKDASQPKEYRGRFDVVYAVDPRIPLSEKARRAGIKEWISTENVLDQTQIPDKPYVVFTHDGTFYLSYTVSHAIEKFAIDEVGEPLTETIDLFLNHPKFFKTRGRDSAGSRTVSGSVPYVDAFNGNPGVNAVSPNYQLQGCWGAGSRGKEIIELGS